MVIYKHMKVTNTHNAKTHLSQLLEEVAGGEEVVIAKAGKPVAVLSPFRTEPRSPGALKGKITVEDDFDELPNSFKHYFTTK